MDIVIAIVVLLLVCGAAVLGYRALNKTGGDVDADSADPVPKLSDEDGRPLGDTDEAHDEINPHDLPLDNPGRHEAEREAGGSEGTLRGPVGTESQQPR